MLSGILRLAITVIGGAALAIAQDEVDTRRLPVLIRGLGTEPISAAEELVQIGKPAVPELLSVVRTRRPPIRYRAIEVLGRMGPEAIEALPVLVEVAPSLGDSEVPTVIRAIGDLLPYREADLPELEATLTPLAMKAYANASAESQVPILMEMDRTLARLAFKVDASFEDLQKALASEDGWVRELGAELLGRRGSEAKPALKTLDELAANFRQVELTSEVQRAAANAVLAIATDEELFIGRAHAIRLRVGTRTEQVASARELRKMAAAIAANELLCSEVVYHLVVEISDDGTSAMAREGIVALGEIGGELQDWRSARYFATTALPLLQSLSRSRDEDVARRAVAALDKIRE